MINANELRIGNKIYPLSDCAEVVEVTDIDEGGRIGTTAFFDGYKGTCDTNTESACGIPLTREWLELCGYEYSMSEKSGINHVPSLALFTLSGKVLMVYKD